MRNFHIIANGKMQLEVKEAQELAKEMVRLWAGQGAEQTNVNVVICPSFGVNCSPSYGWNVQLPQSGYDLIFQSSNDPLYPIFSIVKLPEQLEFGVTFTQFNKP